MRPENAIAGLKVTGIYPLNRDAITLPGSAKESASLAVKSSLALISPYMPSKHRHGSLSSYSPNEMVTTSLV